MQQSLLAELDGILVPDFYVKLASIDPTWVFASSFDDDHDSSPIDQITSKRLLSDARKAAGHLVQYGCVPRGPGDIPRTVAVLAASSYAYYVNELAAFLIGWAPLVISTRNSDDGIAHLIEASRATHIITDAHFSPRVSIQRELNPSLVEIVIREVGSGEEYPLQRELSKDEISLGLTENVLYLHTSGSTGHPKLVPWTHGYLLDVARTLLDGDLYGASVLTPVPLFHGMGFFGSVMWPLGMGVRPVFVHTTKPLTGARLLAQLRRLSDPKSLVFASPATLEEISEIPEGPQELSRLTSRVCWGGAPMRRASGDLLARAGVNIISIYGMSELGALTSFDVASDDLVNDWIYARFSPKWNLLFKPIDNTSRVAELIVLPGENIIPAQFNTDDPKGYATMDLWMPHPTRAGLWKHQGRKDSVIVLSNGEKTDNKQLENLLLEDSRISHAVVFGSGRFLNGVLLSPARKTSSIDNFVDSIWDTVTHVNTIIPQHSRLLRELVVIEKLEKPFVMTDKGTVRSAETLTLYADEINATYDSLLDGGGKTEIAIPEDVSKQSICSYLRAVLTQAGVSPPSDTSDLFESGLDSLLAIKLRSVLILLLRKIGKSQKTVPRNLVYSKSTISSLADFVLEDKETPSNLNDDISIKQRMHDLIAKYTNGLPHVHTINQAITSTKQTVILTGATGSLGCHILADLLSVQTVSAIYCLIRPSKIGNPYERIQDQFKKYDIDLAVLTSNSEKVIFVACDLSQRTLGISDDLFAKLHANVTHVIHNAWELNFNIMLERFEKTHVAGVRHLMEFCLTSRQPVAPHFTFISSIGAVQNYTASPTIPEEKMNNVSVVPNVGYSQSKFVAERMVDTAATKNGLPATVIRGGQISGSTSNGFWNTQEFIPIMLKTSYIIGAVPESLPALRWIPVNIAGKIVTKLALSPGDATRPGASYYHIENAIATPWSKLTDVMVRGAGRGIREVPMDEWIRLVNQAAAAKGTEEVPAAKLLEFLEDFGRQSTYQSVLDVQKTISIAPAVNFGEIGDDLLAKYLMNLRKQ